MEELIIKLLRNNFSLDKLIVSNNSHLHALKQKNSHFKIIAVSDDFKNYTKVELHKKIYQILGQEVMPKIHALAIHTYSLDEWKNVGAHPVDAACMHS